MAKLRGHDAILSYFEKHFRLGLQNGLGQSIAKKYV